MVEQDVIRPGQMFAHHPPVSTLKLTDGAGEALYIRVRHLVGFSRLSSDEFTRVIVADERLKVRETPEEILEMLKRAVP